MLRIIASKRGCCRGTASFQQRSFGIECRGAASCLLPRVARFRRSRQCQCRRVVGRSAAAAAAPFERQPKQKQRLKLKRRNDDATRQTKPNSFVHKTRIVSPLSNAPNMCTLINANETIAPRRRRRKCPQTGEAAAAVEGDQLAAAVRMRRTNRREFVTISSPAAAKTCKFGRIAKSVIRFGRRTGRQRADTSFHHLAPLAADGRKEAKRQFFVWTAAGRVTCANKTRPARQVEF